MFERKRWASSPGGGQADFSNVERVRRWDRQEQCQGSDSEHSMPRDGTLDF